MLAITPEILLVEMETSKKYLEEWIERVKAGIPGVDIPTTQDHSDLFIQQLCGSLLVISGKCENLSHVLSGEA